ncbi:MAG: GldM family protein, partial [Flavobacteriales bacterium]
KVTGSGKATSKNLRATRFLLAKMENFEFDLKFQVVSFTMSATVKGNVVEMKSTGPNVTSDMRKLLNALRRRQKLYIENIKAKGPDGRVRQLGAIVIKVL